MFILLSIFLHHIHSSSIDSSVSDHNDDSPKYLHIQDKYLLSLLHYEIIEKENGERQRVYKYGLFQIHENSHVSQIYPEKVQRGIENLQVLSEDETHKTLLKKSMSFEIPHPHSRPALFDHIRPKIGSESSISDGIGPPPSLVTDSIGQGCEYLLSQEDVLRQINQSSGLLDMSMNPIVGTPQFAPDNSKLYHNVELIHSSSSLEESCDLTMKPIDILTCNMDNCERSSGGPTEIQLGRFRVIDPSPYLVGGLTREEDKLSHTSPIRPWSVETPKRSPLNQSRSNISVGRDDPKIVEVQSFQRGRFVVRENTHDDKLPVDKSIRVEHDFSPEVASPIPKLKRSPLNQSSSDVSVGKDDPKIVEVRNFQRGRFAVTEHIYDRKLPGDKSISVEVDFSPKGKSRSESSSSR